MGILNFTSYSYKSSGETVENICAIVRYHAPESLCLSWSPSGIST